MENRRRCKVSRHGFTLIEIMIVVVIIGMLAAVVGPKLMGNLDKSKAATTKQQLVDLKNAVTQYYADLGDLPNDLNDLMVNNHNDKKWDGPYLEAKSIPQDAWNNDYVYMVPGSDNMRFEILSYGADKTSGGEGYNADISCW